MSSRHALDILRGSAYTPGEYDFDSNPIDARGRSMYLERFIHGEIYKAGRTSTPLSTTTPRQSSHSA